MPQWAKSVAGRARNKPPSLPPLPENREKPTSNQVAVNPEVTQDRRSNGLNGAESALFGFFPFERRSARNR